MQLIDASELFEVISDWARNKLKDILLLSAKGLTVGPQSTVQNLVNVEICIFDRVWDLLSSI